MSEVIDAQVIDGQAVEGASSVTVMDAKPAADPLAELLANPPKAEIVETNEEDLSPEDRKTVEQFMSQRDIKNSQLRRRRKMSQIFPRERLQA